MQSGEMEVGWGITVNSATIHVLQQWKMQSQLQHGRKFQQPAQAARYTWEGQILLFSQEATILDFSYFRDAEAEQIHLLDIFIMILQSWAQKGGPSFAFYDFKGSLNQRSPTFPVLRTSRRGGVRGWFHASGRNQPICA